MLLGKTEASCTLQYGWFTMLRSFLVCNTVVQLCAHIGPHFFVFPSCLDHQRALSGDPSATQQVLISHLFYARTTSSLGPTPPSEDVDKCPGCKAVYVTACVCVHTCV